MTPSVSTSPLATQSDQRLVELAQEGHERAFEELVQRYRAPLLRYCRRLGLSDGRAEDALQHALLQAWLALEQGAQVREPRPWMYRIVHNTAVNANRGHAGEGEAGARLQATPIHGSSTVAASELDHRIAVRDALTDVAALPHMQREAILLSALGGQSHEEVADVLGITHGAVRGLLHRARATLRAAAAAVTPQPLIGWACGSAGRAGPAAERLAEISLPAGVAGMSGALLKGAAMAVTAAVLVSGAAVAPLQRRALHRPSGASPPGRVGEAPRAPASARLAYVADGVAVGSAAAAVPLNAAALSGRARGGGRSDSRVRRLRRVSAQRAPSTRPAPVPATLPSEGAGASGDGADAGHGVARRGVTRAETLSAGATGQDASSVTAEQTARDGSAQDRGQTPEARSSGGGSGPERSGARERHGALTDGSSEAAQPPSEGNPSSGEAALAEQPTGSD